VTLRVEAESIGGNGSVEVNGELRNSQEGFIDSHQQGRELARTELYDDSTRESKISIKPRIQEGTSVDLHTKLRGSRSAVVWTWSKAKVWRIGMSSKDSEPIDDIRITRR
jgi:hypothetical protein